MSRAPIPQTITSMSSVNLHKHQVLVSGLSPPPLLAVVQDRNLAASQGAQTHIRASFTFEVEVPKLRIDTCLREIMFTHLGIGTIPPKLCKNSLRQRSFKGNRTYCTTHFPPTWGEHGIEESTGSKGAVS